MRTYLIIGISFIIVGVAIYSIKDLSGGFSNLASLNYLAGNHALDGKSKGVETNIPKNTAGAKKISKSKATSSGAHGFLPTALTSTLPLETTLTAATSASIAILASTSIQEPASFQKPTSSPVYLSPSPSSNNLNHLLVSEIMIGIDGASNYTFIEFYNPTAIPIDLTGWVVKKKTSTGSESSLIVSSRLNGKIIQPGKYFLTANDAGYTGPVLADVKWPSSYTLAYTNNAVEVYNNLGQKVEEVGWTSIPKNQSYERDSWASANFHLQTAPNPQNSQFQ